MQVSTFMWFDGQAEEAARHYTSVFRRSGILAVQRDAQGNVGTVAFELGGQRFLAYNGGPRSGSGGAISLYVDCDTQEEVDEAWQGLTEGGLEGPGGSLTDRFGVTWQVIPNALSELLEGTEADATERILTAVHTMTKIDVSALSAASAGTSQQDERALPRPVSPRSTGIDGWKMN